MQRCELANSTKHLAACIWSVEHAQNFVPVSTDCDCMINVWWLRGCCWNLFAPFRCLNQADLSRSLNCSGAKEFNMLNVEYVLRYQHPYLERPAIWNTARSVSERFEDLLHKYNWISESWSWLDTKTQCKRMNPLCKVAARFFRIVALNGQAVWNKCWAWIGEAWNLSTSASHLERVPSRLGTSTIHHWRHCNPMILHLVWAAPKNHLLKMRMKLRHAIPCELWIKTWSFFCN